MSEQQQRLPSEARPRPGGRSARVRAAVLHAALEELASVGYSALSLENIARRAGVHKTTVYRRWGTRDALLLEAVLERASQWVPVPDTGSLRDDLLGLAHGVAANITTPEMHAVIRAFVAEAPSASTLAARGREFWAARFALDRQIVVRAIERGELPAEMNPDLVVETLLGPLYFRLLITGEPLDTAFTEELVDLLIAGIKKEQGSAKRRKRSSR